jgi:hypothetical protein
VKISSYIKSCCNSQYIAAVRSSVVSSDHGTGDSEILQGAYSVLVSEKCFLLPLLISVAGSIRKKNSCHALRYDC